MKPIEQGWVLRDSSFMGTTTHDPWLVRQRSPGRQDSGSGQRQNGTLQSPSLCQAVPVPAYCCKNWTTFKKTLFDCPLFNKKKFLLLLVKKILSWVLFFISQSGNGNQIILSWVLFLSANQKMATK